MKKLPISLTLAGITTALLLSTSVAFAQVKSAESQTAPVAITLTAIPPRTDVIHVKPGETFQTAVKLKNTSNSSQTVTTNAQDFVIGKDGKTPIPVTEAEAAPLRWSLASWLTISPLANELEANQTAVYDVLIQVPADALPGGHYAMILHTPSASNSLTQKEANTSTTAVNQRVGTLLYVVVDGDIKENAIIRNFTAPQWVEFGPTQMKFTVENLSDVHITPTASVEVFDLFGKKMGNATAEALNIFPYSQRDFSLQFDQIWGFGPYTAKLTVPYGENGKIAMAQLQFWMIPYKIVLAVLTVLMTLIALIIVVRRHVLHKNNINVQHIEILEERIKDLEKQVKKQ